MLQTIRTYIEQHNLLSEKKPVLVGLSGGADSVALLAVLVRLGYKCIAIHCNFHLRGEESNRDEIFAQEFATGLGVSFHCIDFATEQYAHEKHLSIEMAARELRYQWFEEKRRELDAQAIAVAHHRDDSIETLLINLVRGTGIRGMGGIRPKNGYVIRPFLSVSRQEIIDWLSKEGYSFITDSTNLSDAYTRNFIRLRVLPLLEEINPAARQNIARSSEHLADVEAIYLDVIGKAKEEIMSSDDRISIPLLMSYAAPETILYEILKPYGFNRVTIHDIFLSLKKAPGKLFYSHTHRILKDRDYLWITSLSSEEFPDSYFIESPEDIGHLLIELSFSEIVITSELAIQKNKLIAYFDRDKIHFPLELRHWREGDWFIPFGMTGRQKLSDYFSDHKFSRLQKEQTWLLCSGNDIIWIVGERTDNRYRINSTTKQVLIVKKVY